MIQPKVTVIIPVYNAEKHLQGCLDSASKQTLKDIEIFCVDDCSTDSSPEILARYTEVDNRVSVTRHDNNKGEGASRNTGIDNAKGDYIFHLDADDTIPLDALENLYTEAIAHDSDMVKGRYDMIHDDGQIKHLDWSTPDRKIINTNIYVSSFLQKIPTSHCTYLYRRDFINHHKIRYRTDLCIGLDLVTLATTLLHARAVTLIPDIVYHYYQSDKSAIRGKLKLTTAIDAIRTKQLIINMLKDHELIEAAADFWQTWEYVISTHWCRMPQQLSKDESTQVFNKFRTLITENNIPPWTVNTKHQFRYILALVSVEHDDEALKFLNTIEASEGFSNKESLIESLEFILQHVPNDAGSLIELGFVARKDGDTKLALSFFEKVTENNNRNFGANLQAATLLKELGRYEEAKSKIDTALEILIKKLDSYEIIRQVTTIKENIIHSENTVELDKVRCKLNEVNRELNSVYSSTSWKITEPLRKLMTIIKRIT